MAGNDSRQIAKIHIQRFMGCSEMKTVQGFRPALRRSSARLPYRIAWVLGVRRDRGSAAIRWSDDSAVLLQHLTQVRRSP